MKLFDIRHEFTLNFDEEIYIFISAKYWIHELKT
jgi:hypothetical protein